jgi:signal peptidase II
MIAALKRNSIAFYLCLLVLILDISSKLLVQSYIPIVWHHSWYPYGGIGVFKDFFGIQFSIVHSTNRGAAWGVFAEWQDYLLYLRLALITGLLIYLFFFNKKRAYVIPLTLIVSGAIGNVLDYFLYGQVIDMLHFVLWGYVYPTFNVADSAIFIGIVWMLWLSWGSDKEKKKQPNNST